MSKATSTPVAETPADMPCPRCRVDLVVSERQGIEIDYCSKYGSVWLDHRSELDKTINSDAHVSTAALTMPQGAPTSGPDQSP